MIKVKFSNLANNDLKAFPKNLNGTSFTKVYLAGNLIDCNCNMLWFAHWLNTTEPQSENRIVKDYKHVLCVCVGGGEEVEWSSSSQSKPCKHGVLPKDFSKVSGSMMRRVTKFTFQRYC